MIRLLIFLVKTTLFSVFILVLGQVVEIKGKSISHHIESQIQGQERGTLIRKVRKWSNQMMDQWETSKNEAEEKAKESVDEIKTSQAGQERISESERQKLRSLINQINKD